MTPATEDEAVRHDLRLVPAAGALWLSALTGLLVTWWLGVAIAIAAAAVAAAVWWFGDRRTNGAGAALAVAAAAALWPVMTTIHAAQDDPLLAAAESGGSVAATVTIAGRPKPKRGSSKLAAPGVRRSWLIPAEVDQARVDDRPVLSDGRVLLIAHDKPWEGVLPGQRVSLDASLTTAMRSDLTVAVLQVRGPPVTVESAPWWQRAAQSVRADLRRQASVLDEDEAGLLPGLVDGDTSALPPRVDSEFLAAGMSHLVAVSGTNVAILVGAVLLSLRAARAGPRVSAGLAALALIGFVILVGYEPSVLRAGVMGAVALLALALGRKASVMPALAFAVLLLITVDPAMATDVGFALSVVATAALVLVAPRWAAAMRRRGVPAGWAEAVAIPLAAFIATAPIIAGMAGRISLVTVFANILAAPVVAIATVFGALAAATGPFAPWLATVFVHMAGPAVTWLVWVARQAASMPGAVVSWPGGWLGGVLAALVALALLAAWRLKPVRAGAIGGCVGMLAVSVPLSTVSRGWPPPAWSMVMCDVGQGDGLVLSTGEAGTAVVVDTGNDDGAMDRCLSRLGVEDIPLLLITHLHADHFGGLAAAVDGRKVGEIAVGPARTPQWSWEDVAGTAAKHHIRIITTRVGQRLTWPALTLTVLGPLRLPAVVGGGDDEDGTDINNSSVVMAAQTRAGRILLTGDVELSEQADLMASGADLRADVLKEPHHGSRYVSDDFLRAVAPRAAVISVGAHNTFGHPNPGIIEELRSLGSRIGRTDQDGDIAITPSRNGPELVTRGGVSERGPPAQPQR